MLTKTHIPGLSASCWGGSEITDKHAFMEWALNNYNKLIRIAAALPPVLDGTDVENYIRNVLDGYEDEELS